MKIHEYQAKEILRKFGLPIPPGEVARTPEEAESIAKKIEKPLVIKAQVHVGGRGKAGGIQFAKTPGEAKEVAAKILGMEIKGLRVKKVLVAENVDIENEVYLGIILDRKSKSPVVMVSPEGGIEIEEVAKKTPEKIFKKPINSLDGFLPEEAEDLSSKIFQDTDLRLKLTEILGSLYDAFYKKDASLIEINPLALTPEGDLFAVDAKMVMDDNGLFRHPEIEAMRDLEEEDPTELEAKEKGLSFIRLNGNIGCVVNGAGLAMATMDIIKHYGGEPANFLDIGGSSNPEKVTTAMKILLADPNVKAVYFNIFGGITRCDDVANGIVQSLNQMEVKVPIVIRLTGTNEEKAREILQKTDLLHVPSMAEGAKKAIELAKE
ncbi:ADP-forming succinate--CoA ligase subunit beta [candidate division TA06 bacterium]|nr:ADP-forming succinate--CoA ligase subunit beta [candidate division TA06 bacterium]